MRFKTNRTNRKVKCRIILIEMERKKLFLSNGLSENEVLFPNLAGLIRTFE